MCLLLISSYVFQAAELDQAQASDEEEEEEKMDSGDLSKCKQYKHQVLGSSSQQFHK